MGSPNRIEKCKASKVYTGDHERRWAIVMAVMCVFVEILLNMANVLVWEYPFWSSPFPWLIIFVGYFPFWFVAFKVHDAATMRARLTITGTVLLVDLACIVVFMGVLGWI